MTLRKATRQKAKIRLGLSAVSGGGKTYSALLIASGMTSWDKIAVIDTENNSADLYAHLGEYSVLPLSAPYSPEKYIEAIHTLMSGMAKAVAYKYRSSLAVNIRTGRRSPLATRRSLMRSFKALATL
jgi:hypothetical protein